jgi:uncharacterized protein involved in exopolysaccharide biosynthesis
MKRIVRMVPCLVVGLAMLVAGCAQEKGRKNTADPVIQGYMHSRSDMVAQRRRLAETYGPTSPTVAQVDRQIQLVDEAMAQRRQQIIEQERAQQEVQRMKAEAAPMPGGAAATAPASRSAR